MIRKGARPGAVVSVALLAILLLPYLSYAQQEQQPRRRGMSMFEGFEERSPKAGEMAPDFTLKTLEGDEFLLSEAYARGPVVIEFGSFT